MKLIIDHGNTNIKIYYFVSNKITNFFVFPTKYKNFSFLKDVIFDKSIYSSVAKENKYLLESINSEKIIYFTNETKLPIKNLYKSSTIGKDRLAAAVGAYSLFPSANVLSIDIGSAVTYDLLLGDKYIGGNISPGLRLRFRSLNDYTEHLPLLEPKEIDVFLADNTYDAILCGVINGLLFEIEQYIENVRRLYDAKIILTGGDAKIFAKKIKNPIFAEPNLVAIGLNEILEFNV